jgi:hypothetical protein
MQQLGQPLREVKVSTEQALQRCRRFAEEYDRERRTPPGPARTFELSRIVATVRGSAELKELPEEEIRKLFRESDGGRIVALALIAETGKTRKTGLADLVQEAILDSKSAFEQYQALQAAMALAENSDLPLAERQSLRAAIEEQMMSGPERYITPDSDRWPVAKRVLQRL